MVQLVQFLAPREKLSNHIIWQYKYYFSFVSMQVFVALFFFMFPIARNRRGWSNHWKIPRFQRKSKVLDSSRFSPSLAQFRSFVVPGRSNRLHTP
jgi:hypothetical protein